MTDWQAWQDQGADGITLIPDPVLRDVTYALAERALPMMGVDIGAFMRGEQTEPRPPVEKPRAFLRLVLENADAYDLDSWPLDRVRATVEAVAAHFFFDCVKSLTGLMLESEA